LKDVILDCEAGRRLGCATLCCRLIVRYAPDEAPLNAQGVRKSCVDKDPSTGLCIHFNVELQRCSIWSERPRVCREYDCNQDPLLRVVLRDGFTSLTRLVLARQEEDTAGGAPLVARLG